MRSRLKSEKNKIGQPIYHGACKRVGSVQKVGGLLFTCCVYVNTCIITVNFTSNCACNQLITVYYGYYGR